MRRRAVCALRSIRAYFRPTEADLLVGDPTKAHRVLGWKAVTPFGKMVEEMVQSDLRVVARQAEHRRLDEDHGPAALR
jgi:GDPmannose 4,6-dehydratase